MRLTIRAHAKINLNLRVVGVRPDGYHLLETVFQSLALHDVLTVDAHVGPFQLACTDAAVPADGRNLVWKAAVALWREAGRHGEVRGATVHVDKRIPPQGGLGGGSADGAAALVALNQVWGTGLERDRLSALAARLGADVPFFLSGGTAVGLGRGDEIHLLDDVPPQDVVLVFPRFGVSTPQAFGWFDQDVAQGSSVAEKEVGSRLAGSRAPAIRIFNELQPSVASRHPEIGQLCSRLRDAGAEAAAMTGSGSTVFGLFAGRELAGAAAAALAGEGWRTLHTRTVSRSEAVAAPLLT